MDNPLQWGCCEAGMGLIMPSNEQGKCSVVGIGQRNVFQILLYQTEIRLYSPFSDWFGTVNGLRPFAVPNQSEKSEYNLISVWFKKISGRFDRTGNAVLGVRRIGWPKLPLFTNCDFSSFFFLNFSLSASWGTDSGPPWTPRWHIAGMHEGFERG